jgi:molybdenum cofactor cytidylyltransferase
VHNEAYSQGLSTSLRTGLDALPADLDGAIVALGDMPRVAATDLDRMIAAFSPKEGRAVVLPVHDGKRGNPVLWSAEFFPEMRKVSGDAGAKHLLGDNAERIAEIELADDRALMDVDTPEALAALRAQTKT